MEALDGHDELKRLLVRTLREADFYRTAYLRANSAQLILEEELLEAQMELWRAQRRQSIEWGLDEHTVDLSQYPGCSQSEDED